MPRDEVATAVLLEPLKRVGALRRLREGPASRGELQDELDVSRATLHRIATFLDEEGLAVETDGDLALTTVGREVAAAAAAYEQRVGTARRLAPLLNEVDLDALPVGLDVTLLDEAEVVRPKPGQPGLPSQRVVDAVERAGRVRGLAPVVLPIYVEAFHRAILDGMATELVFAPDAVEGLDESYAEKFHEALATDRLDVFVHEAVPFGLYLTPERVGIAGHDGDGVVQIVVEGDDEALRSWAERVYRHYRDDATPA